MERWFRFESGFQGSTQVVELAGGTDILVSAGDELRVFVDEDFPGRTEIELLRIVAEVLTVNAGPDEAAIRVDVDLGHSLFGGGKVFVHVYAHGVFDLAAGFVDAGNFVLRHGG